MATEFKLALINFHNDFIEGVELPAAEDGQDLQRYATDPVMAGPKRFGVFVLEQEPAKGGVFR